MTSNKVTSDFFKTLKEQLFKEIMDEIRPGIVVESNQRRFNVAEAAEYLGMSEDTLYTLCREKKIPHYKVGSSNSRKQRIYFRVNSLEEWVNKQESENCAGWT